jgi:phosphatidate cytidylyltransferase
MTEKNLNLFWRVATAAVLLPLVIWLIWRGDLWFALLISVASSLGALELNLLPYQAPLAPPPETERPDDSDLTRKERKQARAAALEAHEHALAREGQLSGAAIASAGGAFLLPLLHLRPLPFLSVELVLAAVTVAAFCDALFFERELALAPRRVGLALLGTVYSGLLLSALVRLRAFENGFWWIILALTVTWANDTGAYFSGRALGRHKLFPRISPSKTWEGAIGGTCASIAGALVVAYVWLHQLPLWGAALIGLGAAVLGPLGDLSESMLKRAYGAKDSGRMLPGHGGMLDRIDALLFNAPFVLLCARLLVR